MTGAHFSAAPNGRFATRKPFGTHHRRPTGVVPSPASSGSGRYPAASSPSGITSTASSPSSSGLPQLPPASSVSGLIRAFRPRLQDLLVTRGLINQTQIDRLLREQPQVGSTEPHLIEALIAGNLVKDSDIVKTLSEHSGIGWISDDELVSGSTPEAAKALTQELAERWKVAPIKLVERQLHLAMPDPRDVTLIDKLRFGTSLKIIGSFATATGIRRANGKLYRGEDPNRSEVASWHGQLLDPQSGGLPLEPFSDRYTGTREHQFDTGEFERTPGLEPSREPPPPFRSSPSQASASPVPGTRPPSVGQRFAGRYQLEALIGEGGSASVYRALDIELNEPVAIKLFSPATASDLDTMVARFKLELSLSRILSHPNIIRLFDLGAQGEWRYLTMELLEGEDLASTITNSGRPISIDQGLRYLEQACSGLHLAHERGVVHRDIKPHNLFVTKSGEVKVMDFGIARKMNTPGVTMVGTIAGTPEYMSPEQINGFSDVTFSTDLYALGVTAYQMFTGTLPFEHPELMRLLIAQATEAPPRPRTRNPEIPEVLEQVLLKLLEKKPADRPSSAGELGAMLRGIRISLKEAQGG